MQTHAFSLGQNDPSIFDSASRKQLASGRQKLELNSKREGENGIDR